MKTYKRKNICFVNGNGCYLYDEDNNKYLDFVSGIAANTLGHSNKIITDTICRESRKLIHLSNLYFNKNQIELAEKLIKLSGLNSVFFSNSGTEAVEAMIKIIKKHGKNTNRNKILYMSNSFHGRTLGSLLITDQEKYKKPFNIKNINEFEVKYNNIKELYKKVDDEVIAIILEIVQGEGGLNVVKKEFIDAIIELTSEKDIILAIDEVQSGIARTGKMFAYEHFNIKPDILCLAKGLAGGVPIGATIVNKKYDNLTYSDHGSTFGGNPLSTSVANAVLDNINNKEFLNSVMDKSLLIKSIIKKLGKKHNLNIKILGLGLLLGFKIEGVKNLDIVDIAFKEKLLLVSSRDDVVRILPPLNISLDEIKEFEYKLENVFNKIVKIKL